MTLDAIRSLTQPGRWTAGSDRTPLEGAGKEGTPVVVTGFLKIAKQEHGESCNCGLDDPEGVNTDIHLVIVSRVTDPEASSVTMEMTPRVRAAGHANYLATRVKPLQGKFVRVTGWLMLDTAHIRRPLVRATNWEVHPITKFEICTTNQSACEAGNGWQEL